MLPVVIGVVILALLGGVIGGVLRSRQDTPEKAVQRYFEALGSKDELAKTVTNPPTSAGRSEPLPAVEHFELRETTAQGTRVSADYVGKPAGGEEHSERVELETRKVGNQYKVVGGYPQLEVRGQLPFLLELSEIDAPTRIALLPGTYDVASKGNVGEVVGDRVVRLKPGEHKTITVQQRLGEEGVERLRRSVENEFIGCLGKHEPAPTGCPFKVAKPADQQEGTQATWGLPRAPGAPLPIEVTVQRDQGLEKACAVVIARPAYQYWSTHFRPNPEEPNHNTPTWVPAATDRFVGCRSLTGKSGDEVTWQS